MTETLWVELIRTLPTLLWIGVAIAALLVVRRILGHESHRIERVETSFVKIRFAEAAIDQARSAAAAATAPPVGPVAPPPDALDDTASAADGEPRDETEPAGSAPLGTTPPAMPYPMIPPIQRPPPYDSEPRAGAQGPPEPSSYPYGVGTGEHGRGLEAATRLADSIDLLQGGSLLWVDDHPERNASLVLLFHTAGIDVLTVESTEQAMRALAHRGFDLVVTDVNRGNGPAGRDAGRDLLDRMARQNIATPVVVYTGDVNTPVADHPLAAAIVDGPEDLVDRVIDHVGHLRDRRPSRYRWGRRGR